MKQFLKNRYSIPERINSRGEIFLPTTIIEEDDETFDKLEDICYSFMNKDLDEEERNIRFFSDIDEGFSLEHSSHKSLTLWFNKYDGEICGFSLSVEIGGVMRDIDSKNYLENGFKDDIFHKFIVDINTAFELEKKDSLAVYKNNYLDAVTSIYRPKSEAWRYFNELRKHYSPSHFKNDVIYFDNNEIYVFGDTIYYNGYKEGGISLFINNYKRGKYSKRNEKLGDRFYYILDKLEKKYENA